MVKVKFFAALRERLNCDHIALDAHVENVIELKAALLAQHPDWSQDFEEYGKLVAVNQAIVDFQYPLKDGDEVAFFPPVTGG